MLTALTFTPSTSTRLTSSASLLGHSIGDLRFQLLGDLRFNPRVGAGNAVFERDLRLPAKHLAQPVVVGVAATHTLRPGHVLPGDLEARRVGDQVGELVDADQTVLTEIDRLLIARLHQQPQALDAVVDVAERTRLLAVAPDLDLTRAGQLGAGDLAAHRRRRFLASAVPRAERADDVVEADDAHVDAVF